MTSIEIERIIERRSRSSRWNTVPDRLNALYGNVSQEMHHSCYSAESHHHSQVNSTRMMLVILFLLTVPFSIKVLNLDYTYGYVAQNKVDVSVGIIEELDILFGKQ